MADAFPNVDIPAVVEDRCGHTCLIILPSDKPSSRGEALAVEMLLAEALKDPQQAIYRQVKMGTGLLHAVRLLPVLHAFTK